MEKVREKVLFALQEVQRAVIGKQEVTETVMKAFLAGGHVLVEDIPGLGKTTMAIAFSRAIGLQKRRVQFTPDVLPSDLNGFTIYQKERNAFVYHPGAVVCNLLLADEINRASPKTQSALLEVMEEGQVTVDGKTRKIAPPFLVIATENPSGSAGTQLLPESQLDRFMVCVKMGYPTIREEMEILRKNENGRTSDAVQQVMTKEELANKIATFTGGRAAEELIFHSITTGASNDIEQATKLARAMISRYGMSEDFDMVAMENVTNQYLGGDSSLSCSFETQTLLDKKVVELVRMEHQKALKILQDNIGKLHELAKYLYEHETITGEEFMKILNAPVQVPTVVAESESNTKSENNAESENSTEADADTSSGKVNLQK